MAQVEANAISLEYETHGNPSNPALIIVRGLGTQMINWAPSFVQGFVDKGLYVVQFDNRDVGLSHKFEEAGIPDIDQMTADAAAGKPLTAAYTVHDMAKDVVGLMDGLRIHQAHIMGISMGGMIVQLVAATYPDRIMSMTSIMSSSGDPDLPPATDERAPGFSADPKAHLVKTLFKTQLRLATFGQVPITRILRMLSLPAPPRHTIARTIRLVICARWRPLWQPGIERRPFKASKCRPLSFTA